MALKLPTQKVKPASRPEDQTITIYGPYKIGKSTFVSQMKNVFFFAFEMGLKHLETMNLPVNSWPEFLEIIDMIEKSIKAGNCPYNTVALDVVDQAYNRCREHVLAQNKAKHESDLPYGKGWTVVQEEFRRQITRLQNLPLGLVFVSHAKEISVTGFDGKEHNKWAPTLPEKAREMTLGISDLILFATVEQSKDDKGKSGFRRVLRTKPSQDYEAGDRTGRGIPHTIELSYPDLLKWWEAGEKTDR